VPTWVPLIELFTCSGIVFETSFAFRISGKLLILSEQHYRNRLESKISENRGPSTGHDPGLWNPWGKGTSLTS
jgi:hypothetical protein